MTSQPINGTPPQQQLQIPIECAPRGDVTELALIAPPEEP